MHISWYLSHLVYYCSHEFIVSGELESYHRWGHLGWHVVNNVARFQNLYRNVVDDINLQELSGVSEINGQFVSLNEFMSKGKSKIGISNTRISSAPNR